MGMRFARGGKAWLARGRKGQMTIELAVAMPVLIVVAVISVNALTFIADCAVFDRVAHEAVRVYAAAPAYGQGPDQACSQVEATVAEALGEDNLEVSVSRGATGLDLDQFTATLVFHPTLFGMGLRSEVLGVPMPTLSHSTVYVIDSYKPGVVI